MPAMSFGNAGAALGAAGGALSGLARKVQKPAGQGGGGVSPRAYRKMLQAKVDAYREVSSIDTAERETRLGQTTSEMLKLKEAGFHTIDHETPDARVRAVSEPGTPSVDRAYNPSHDVHGHPGEGFVHYHGFTGDAQSLPGAHSKNVLTINPTAVRVTPLPLEGGKVAEEARPVYKAGSTGVVKTGSFMDQPEKAQPAIAEKLKSDGAIPMGSSTTKGKLKGPKLKKDPESGKLTEAGWEEKLSAQEGAELAKRKAKIKDKK